MKQCEKAETAKALTMGNWLKILIEMGYTEEQVESLMTDYYGSDWKNVFPDA